MFIEAVLFFIIGMIACFVCHIVYYWGRFNAVDEGVVTMRCAAVGVGLAVAHFVYSI